MYNGTPPEILLVDDIPANLRLLVALLQEAGYRARPVNNGRLALQAAFASVPDLILLDISMPDLNGYEVCSQLKADPRFEDVPIIFVSAADEIVDKVRAFDVGGVDYVTKPFHEDEVLARIRTHLELRQKKLELENLREQDRLYFETLTTIKDDFMSSASHDLKTPLTSIQMAAYMLRRFGADNPDRFEQYLTNIENSVEQMTTLITNLLDLAKLETGRAIDRQPVPFTPFLQEIVDGFDLIAQEKQMEIHFHASDTAITVNCDAVQVRRVMNNLISNAIKYSPPERQIDIEVQKQDEEVVVAVTDQGFGIPAEDIPKLFTRFFRVDQDAHSAAEGSGLGLAIVKTVIEQHGGQVWVESELDQGSTFFFCLPI